MFSSICAWNTAEKIIASWVALMVHMLHGFVSNYSFIKTKKFSTDELLNVKVSHNNLNMIHYWINILYLYSFIALSCHIFCSFSIVLSSTTHFLISFPQSSNTEPKYVNLFGVYVVLLYIQNTFLTLMTSC